MSYNKGKRYLLRNKYLLFQRCALSSWIEYKSVGILGKIKERSAYCIGANPLSTSIRRKTAGSLFASASVKVDMEGL